GFGPMEMGWCCATQSMAALVAPLAAGQVADRWWPAEKCLMVLALLAGIFLWILAGLTQPIAVFSASLAYWLVMAPAITLGTSVSFAHLPDPGRDFGFVRLWGTIGWVVAGWLVGYWLSVPSWVQWLNIDPGRIQLGDAFRLGGLFSITLGIYALTLPHTPPQRSFVGWLAPIEALQRLRSRQFIVYWMSVFGVCVIVPFTSQVTPLLLKHQGVPKAWLAPTLTIGQSTEVAFLALLPMLLLRFGVRGTMFLGLFAWWLYLSVLTLGEPTWLVISSITMNGLFICCFLVAGQVFVNSRARADIRASAQALVSFTSGFGMLVGHLLVGWVRREVREDFRPTFLVGACIATLVLMVFGLGFPRDKAEV
ncbi:MAG TPA: MFS transporter, partial [Gemmataceae bacterium]|nr:MFS transporter [Gemmataceae bacterium]